MQQLSALDAIMIFLESPHAPNTLTMAWLYDPTTAPGGRVAFADVARNIESRLHLARSFRQRLVRVPLDLDEPYWIEDPDFDLEFHLRHIALPKPGNWTQLNTQIARLASRPLDMTRPLWELYLIEGLDDIDVLPPSSFALLLKIHHACIDGMSGVEMQTALSDASAEAAPPPPDKSWKPEAEPSTAELMRRASVHAFTRPLQIGRALARSAPALRNVRLPRRRPDVEDLRPPGLAVPRTRFNGRVTAHRVLDARWYPLDTAKRMRAAVDGATVNDVALTVVAGAMRAYLTAKGELPQDSLVAVVPVSTRTKDEVGMGGNRVSMVRTALYTDIADPLERLSTISRVMQRLKQQTNAIGARTLTEISQQVPGRLMGAAQRATMRLALRAGMSMGSNTVVTNVPGPQTPLYFAGARLVRTYGAGPLVDGGGLIHPIGSYCGELMFLFTACREMMPDPEFYAECIDSAFTELEKATA
jgi:diacylglycerol O-acyltransferase